MIIVQKVIYFLRLHFIQKHNQVQVKKKYIIFLLGQKYDSLDSQKNSDKKSPRKPFNFHFSTNSSVSNHNNNFILRKNVFYGNKYVSNTLFGDNYDFNSRIKEKTSVYSRSQWKKDFKRSRVYKKISCEYPSINFVAKKKRNLKNNFKLSPCNDINMFNAMNFKPFTSVDIDESQNGSPSKINSKSNARKRSKKRKLGYLYKEKNFRNKDGLKIQSSEGSNASASASGN